MTFDLSEYFNRSFCLIHNLERALFHTAMNQLVASYVVRLLETKVQCLLKNFWIGQTLHFLAVDGVVESPLAGFLVVLAFADSDCSGFGPLINLDRQH